MTNPAKPVDGRIGKVGVECVGLSLVVIRGVDDVCLRRNKHWVFVSRRGCRELDLLNPEVDE